MAFDMNDKKKRTPTTTEEYGAKKGRNLKHFSCLKSIRMSFWLFFFWLHPMWNTVHVPTAVWERIGLFCFWIVILITLYRIYRLWYEMRQTGVEWRLILWALVYSLLQPLSLWMRDLHKGGEEDFVQCGMMFTRSQQKWFVPLIMSTSIIFYTQQVE